MKPLVPYTRPDGTEGWLDADYVIRIEPTPSVPSGRELTRLWLEYRGDIVVLGDAGSWAARVRSADEDIRYAHVEGRMRDPASEARPVRTGTTLPPTEGSVAD